jgi:type IV secretion system protein VirD4
MQSVYKLPNSPRNNGGVQWQAVTLGLFILFFANIIATQYMAYGFKYQNALGYPIADVSGHGFYPPYMWIIWFLKFNQIQNAEAKQVLWIGLTIAAGGAGVSVLTSALVMFFRTRKLQKGNEHLHGSARWASRVDIEEAGLIGHGEGVYIGAWQDPKTKAIHYLRHNGNENIIAFAPTGSGKGVGLVLPTLLSWPHSCVAYDIKGENYALTSGWRQREAGNKVFKFSPLEMGVGAQFNPLSEIRLGTPRDVSDAQNIAHMLTHPKGDSDDEDHWVESATSLLTGVILYACYAALKEGRIACLPDVAQVLTKPGQSFSETLNEMLLDPLDEEYAYGWQTVRGKQTSVHPVVAEKAQEMLDKEEKELSGILSSAKVKLQLYSDPIVSSNIRRSDFTVDDLVNGEKPATLYLVVPSSDKDRLRPLTRLIFTIIVSRLTESMQFENGRSVQTSKHRLLMMLDEFPTLGRMESLVNSMAYTRGYGIKYYLIVQDKIQLNNVYGENELVFSGTHLRIAYAPNNPETAELLSRMTGTTTVVKAAFSYSGNRLSPMLGQVSTNVEEIERPLMTPDECGRLPGPKKDAHNSITEAGDMLIFPTGFPPIYGKQILYFNDPVFSRRAKIPAPTTSAAPFVRNPVIAKAPTKDGQGAMPLAKPQPSQELTDYPPATPDVAAEDDEAVMRHHQAHNAQLIGEPATALVDYEEETDEGNAVDPKLHRCSTDEPPQPAAPYVRKAPPDAEMIEASRNPDMRPIEPAKVKPPKRRNV